MTNRRALVEAFEPLLQPRGYLSDEEALALLRRLRRIAADLAEELIDLLDRIDGDPDLEIEEDYGVEDGPHDEVDEGNDEPSLAFSGEPVLLTSGSLLDGEVDEAEETPLRALIDA